MEAEREAGRQAGRQGGRDDVMQGVEEERVEGGRVDEGNERGRDGTGHGRREGKRGGRKRAEDGLSEEGREYGRKGERETSREVVYSQTIHKPALALETLVLQMTNSEHVYIINSVL